MAKSLIAAGIGVAAVIIVAAFLYIGNNEKASMPSIEPNATIASSNATLSSQSVHHYQVKVSEAVEVGDRP